MKVGRIVSPGQPGTKKLVERYGDNLLCVRYRYDDQKKTMYKTIEIIIDEKPWQGKSPKVPNHETADIRISFNEVELRSRIKECGGKWDPQKKVWQLPYRRIKELDLLDRIVNDE